MDYAFFPKLMVRNPTFSYQDYSAVDYDQLLLSNFFRAAIYLASTDFYRELEKRGFKYQELSSAQQNTLRKYYNRACFRPTPFGAFSSIATTVWSQQEEQVRLSNGKGETQIKLDYLPELELCETLVCTEAKHVLQYRVNASLYKVSKHFRYIKHDKDARKKRSFSVISLTENKMLSDIIAFCTSERMLSEIAPFLAEKTALEPEAVDAMVDQLIGEQIILPLWGASITGEGCLEDLIAHLAAKGVWSQELEKIRIILNGLNDTDINEFDNILRYASQVESLLNEPEEIRSLFYSVTDRGQTEGGLDVKFQQMIRDGLHCLNTLMPMQRSMELEDFKRAFTEKFEGREIPLLTALDPELGIGYENQEEVIYREDALLKDVRFDGGNKGTDQYLKWTAGHSLLLNRLQQKTDGEGNYQIELSEKDLAGITQDDTHYKLPPSMSVVFRMHNDMLYLESAGGASATSLVGRFSVFSDEVLSAAREIAQTEQALNSEVLFAEIAHLCDPHAANINRRKHIRDYEIPVLVTSTLQQDRQIGLSDLFISVQNDQIILRSRKHNTIVVPRLSSAFNHNNSDLPVFRFLCDLQYQGLKTAFKLELSSFFPGLKFYPRVVYRSTILSLATWHLGAADFTWIKNSSPEQCYESFIGLAKQIGLPRYFTLTHHDNQLVFDRDKPEEALLFLDAVKNSERITLNEFLMNERNTAAITDAHNKPFIGQYIAAMYLREAVYDVPGHLKFEGSRKNNRNFVPGTEWLYFKIYCHPVLTNELLCNVLAPLLHRVYKKKLIDKWFYVRYTDPDHHIRLRLHVTDGSLEMLIAAFSRRLKILLDERKIQKYYIDTYIRELERYAPADIGDVESYFFSSSLLMTDYIRRTEQSGSQYSYDLDVIMLSVNEILDAFELTQEQRISLFQDLYTSFYREHGEDKDLKKSLEKKYGDVRKEMNEIQQRLYLLREEMGEYYDDLFGHSKLIAARVRKSRHTDPAGIMGDMIHMHLNRLFVQTPRRQELIIYYLLYRHYSAQMYKGQLTTR